MKQSEKVRLHFGPYKSPPVEVGQEVRCALRGLVTVKGFTRGRIRWPYHQPRSEPMLIIFGELERALRKESTLAVAHWWRVGKKTVTTWRRLLGVPIYNPGTVKLRRAGYDDPSRGSKISKAKTGTKRGPPSAETRKRISEALRRRNSP